MNKSVAYLLPTRFHLPLSLITPSLGPPTCGSAPPPTRRRRAAASPRPGPRSAARPPPSAATARSAPSSPGASSAPPSPPSTRRRPRPRGPGGCCWSRKPSPTSPPSLPRPSLLLDHARVTIYALIKSARLKTFFKRYFHVVDVPLLFFFYLLFFFQGLA